MKHPIHTAIILSFIILTFQGCYDRSASNFYVAREYQKLIALGKMDRSPENYQKIDKYYRKSLEFNPDNPVVNMNYGEFLFYRNRVIQAVNHLKRAIKHKPDYYTCHVLLSYIYLIKENNPLYNRDAAKRHLVQAEAFVDKTNPRHLEALANVYIVDERSAKALKAYNLALDLAPNDFLMINNFAMFLVTVKDKKYRDPKRALKLAKRAEALSGGRKAFIIDTLAEAHHASGNYKEAVLEARRAIFLSGSSTETLIYKKNLKRFEKALREKSSP